MTDTSIFKSKLEAELTQITTNLSSIATQDPHTGDWVAIPNIDELDEADENAEADATETWNERRATLSQLETQYQNIVRALAKIETGSYGTCEICGDDIEEDRLSFIPTARTCKVHRDDERTLAY